MKEAKCYCINNDVLLVLRQHQDGIHYWFSFADGHETSGEITFDCVDNWQEAMEWACNEIYLPLVQWVLISSRIFK